MSLATPLMLALIAVSAVLTGCGDGRHATSGPLGPRGPGSAGYSVPLDVGKLHTLGLSLENRSDRPMVLDTAIGVDQRGPREIVATAILHHPDYIVYGQEGFPPRGVGAVAHPVKGWVVAPHENDDVLIFGVRVKRGRWSMRKVRIEYHAGSRHYVDDLPFAFATCAPLAKWLDKCSPPRLS